VCAGTGQVPDLPLLTMTAAMQSGMLMLGSVLVKNRQPYMVRFLVRQLPSFFGDMPRRMTTLCLLVVCPVPAAVTATQLLSSMASAMLCSISPRESLTFSQSLSIQMTGNLMSQKLWLFFLKRSWWPLTYCLMNGACCHCHTWFPYMPVQWRAHSMCHEYLRTCGTILC